MRRAWNSVEFGIQLCLYGLMCAGSGSNGLDVDKGFPWVTSLCMGDEPWWVGGRGGWWRGNVGLGGERVVGIRASVVKCHCGHLPAADGELVGNPHAPNLPESEKN